MTALSGEGGLSQMERYTGRDAKWLLLGDLARAAKRTRAFGDFWGHMLVARGAAEVMIEPELRTWDTAAVRVIVEQNACDAALLFGSQGHGQHFRYLTNFAPVLGDMWLIAGPEERLVCVLDFDWQLEEARRRSGIEEWHGRLDGVEVVADTLAGLGPKRIAIAGLERLPVTVWHRVRERIRETEVVDVGTEVATLRRRKSPLEIRLLQEAARLTDVALDVARTEARPGVSERDLAARLGQALGPEWSFPPTVVSVAPRRVKPGASVANAVKGAARPTAP